MSLLADARDTLLFRIDAERIKRFGWAHLALGLIFTWIVGIGRWYDDEKAIDLQQLGVGSLLYVFVLALVIWIFGKGIANRRNWRYFTVLVYVTLTAPPAIIYALPVEKFFELDIAVKINLWFLAFVAAWRVALLVRLYAVLGEMNRLQTAICATLPVSLIIFIISSAGFANQIVNAMGGLRKDEPQNVDFLTRISGTAFLLSIAVGTTAFILWIAEQVKARKSK